MPPAILQMDVQAKPAEAPQGRGEHFGCPPGELQKQIPLGASQAPALNTALAGAWLFQGKETGSEGKQSGRKAKTPTKNRGGKKVF